MLIVLRLVHDYVRNERTNEIWVLPTFCTPIVLFFWGSVLICAHSFLGPIFFKKSMSHNPVSRTRSSCLAVRSSLLSLCCALTHTRWSILTSPWLMLADRSLFCVARYPVISRWLLLLSRRFAPCWFSSGAP